MKKLTAGIFTVLMGLVSVNAADAAVASKGYVTQEINKVNANVTAVDTKVGDLKYSSVNYITQDEGLTVSAGKLDKAIKDLADDLSDATGGSTGRLDAIEATLNGTGEGSVASKIAAAVKTEEDARKAADNALTQKDTALQGEIDAAEGRLDTIEADFATKAYADAKVDNAAIGDDAATKTTVAPSVAQVAAYVGTQWGSIDDQVKDLSAELGTSNAGIAGNAAAIEELKTADTTIDGKIGGEFTAENTVAKAIEAASSAASAAQADADALEALVGNTAVGTQIDTKIAALALKKISQVPAQCSDPTKYCALTYGSDGFVWEVIERGDDEVLGYGNDAGRIDSNVDAAAGE